MIHRPLSQDGQGLSTEGHLLHQSGQARQEEGYRQGQGRARLRPEDSEHGNFRGQVQRPHQRGFRPFDFLGEEEKGEGPDHAQPQRFQKVRVSRQHVRAHSARPDAVSYQGLVGRQLRYVARAGSVGGTQRGSRRAAAKGLPVLASTEKCSGRGEGLRMPEEGERCHENRFHRRAEILTRRDVCRR